MTFLESADVLCDRAAEMIDYLQGWVDEAPLEELGGAIAEYRRRRENVTVR